MDDANGAAFELTAPLALAVEFDSFMQQNFLDAAAFVPEEGRPSRTGVPAEVFEQAWEAAARTLAPYVEEATGASSQEVDVALRDNEADCSAALITLLHQRGDEFQQACAAAAAQELKRRRQERSLEVIVRDAALQGRLPPELTRKRMLRMLRRHLPLSEIMGHRYRTEAETDHPGVTFEDDQPSRRRRSKSRTSRSRVRSRGRHEEDDFDSDDDDDDESHQESSGVDSEWDDEEESGYETSEGDEDSDASDSSDDSGGSRRSKSSRGSRSSKRKRQSSLMAVPPQNWDDGDAPVGGFYLETFTKIYQQYVSFKALHKGTGLTFKSLIQAGLEDTVRCMCDIETDREYKNMSEAELLKRIKSSLRFSDDDYFARQLELLELPDCDQTKATELYRAFRKLTTPFLRILREAKDSGVRLRKANVVQIFKNHIRGFTALERWFRSRSFKSLNEAIRHISQELHQRVANDIAERHDTLVRKGRVAGVRHALQGGKVEAGQAHARDSNDRRNGKRQGANLRNHPDKRPKQADRTSPGKYPQRSAQEEATFQAALQKEKDLPQGMFFHPRGSFCQRASLVLNCQRAHSTFLSFFFCYLPSFRLLHSGNRDHRVRRHSFSTGFQ